MAIPILNHLDFQKTAEIQNVLLHTEASGNVTSPGTGQIIYDSGTVKFYNGSSWVSVGTSSGSMSNFTLTGDSGSNQTIEDGNTLDVAGGTGATTVVGATDTVTVNVDAAQTGITSVVNASLEIGRDADNRIKFGTDNQIIFEVDGADGITMKASGEIEATKFDGALEGNADTATLASTVTLVDAAEASTTYYPALVDGLTGAQALEAESGFTFVGNTGILTATGFAGTLQTAAQTNITSLGTLTALTVDDVAIDGKVVTMTGSSSDTATLTVGTNGTLDITTTDAAAAAANIQITADGTAELAGTTVTLDSSGGITLDADGGTITFADAGSSLGTITSSGYSGQAATVATIAGLAPNTATTQATQGAITSAAALATVGTITSGTWQATDVGIAYGGTGQSTAAAAANALLNVSQGGALSIGDGSDTITIPGDLTVTGTTTTNNVETVSTSNGVVFEGGTLDGHDGTLISVVAGADVTYTLPNVAGYVALFSADPSTTAISSTVAELNIMDGGTSATSTTVADADRVVYNDAGTMKQVAMTDLAAYFDDEITAMPNLVTVGTIGSGTWNGGVIASAYLDADTAHVAVAQTLTNKTLTSPDINGGTWNGTVDGNSTAAGITWADLGSVTTIDINGGTINGITDLAIADGGTGASTASAALTALGAEASANKVTKLLSGGAATTYNIEHDFGTPIVNVQVLDYGNAGSGATYDVVQVEIQRNDDDSVDLIFAAAPGTSQDYLVLVSKFPAIS